MHLHSTINGSIALSIFGIVMLMGVGACTPPRVVTTGTTPETVHTSAPVADAEFWTPQLATGSRDYALRDSSIISISSDSSTQPLLIETSANYTVAATASGDSLVVFGKIDSLTINSRIHAKQITKDSTQSDQFRGALSKQGELRQEHQPQALSCSSTSTSLASRIYEIITPYLKPKVKIGDVWSDTISNTTCHGRTPLTQQTIRQFEVKGFTTWQDRPAVQIQRRTAITFTGSSTETNTHLSTSGSGSGEAMLLIDRVTSTLLESTGQNKSTLMISTSRGQFPFTQSSFTHIIVK